MLINYVSHRSRIPTVVVISYYLKVVYLLLLSEIKIIVKFINNRMGKSPQWYHDKYHGVW